MVNVIIDEHEAGELCNLGLVDIKNVSNPSTGRIEQVVEIVGLAQEFQRILDRLMLLENKK